MNNQEMMAEYEQIIENKNIQIEKLLQLASLYKEGLSAIKGTRDYMGIAERTLDEGKNITQVNTE